MSNWHILKWMLDIVEEGQPKINFSIAAHLTSEKRHLCAESIRHVDNVSILHGSRPPTNGSLSPNP